MQINNNNNISLLPFILKLSMILDKSYACVETYTRIVHIMSSLRKNYYLTYNVMK